MPCCAPRIVPGDEVTPREGYHLTFGPGSVLADGEKSAGILYSVIQGQPSYIILFGLATPYST